jgi:hypothetical protein
LSDYTRKTETERARMADEELLEWIATARDAGDFEHARDSCGMLAFRYEDRIQAKIRNRTPNAFVEDVFMEVMVSVTRSAFDGKFVGQFGSWINTITQRRIVDFHRKRGRQPQQTIFEEEHESEDGVWVHDGADDERLSLLPYIEIAETVRKSRPKEMHRLVIQLYGPVELGYGELDAASTCEQVERRLGETISEDNVAQIWKRFRVDFAAELEKADEDPGGAGS